MRVQGVVRVDGFRGERVSGGGETGGDLGPEKVLFVAEAGDFGRETD